VPRAAQISAKTTSDKSTKDPERTVTETKPTMTVTDPEKQDLSTMDQMEQEIHVTPASNIGASSYGASGVPMVTASAVPDVLASAVSNAGSTVEVIAPSDLMGGYQFNVNAGNKSLLVKVVGTYVVLFRLLSPTSNLKTSNMYLFFASLPAATPA
jgi:hypothetical protein